MLEHEKGVILDMAVQQRPRTANRSHGGNLVKCRRLGCERRIGGRARQFDEIDIAASFQAIGATGIAAGKRADRDEIIGFAHDGIYASRYFGPIFGIHARYPAAQTPRELTMAPRRLNPLCDRIGRENVDRVIVQFYRQLRSDDLLSPFFADLKNPAEHERRVADFWWIAMGGKPVGTQAANDMLGLHAALGLTGDHFERWLLLFLKALDSTLDPVLADAWMTMAGGIAARLRASLAAV